MRSLSEPHTKRVHDHIHPDADRTGNQRNAGKDAEQGGKRIMGTRNLTAVYIDGEYKVAQYGQ